MKKMFWPEENDIHTILDKMGIVDPTKPLYFYDGLDDGCVIASTKPLTEEELESFYQEEW